MNQTGVSRDFSASAFKALAITASASIALILSAFDTPTKLSFRGPVFGPRNLSVVFCATPNPQRDSSARKAGLRNDKLWVAKLWWGQKNGVPIARDAVMGV